MTEQQRKWDALTVFFFVAAIILAGMWWLEQRGLDALDEANIAAGEFSRDHLGPDCEAFAAGHDGQTLVVRCADLDQLEAAVGELKQASRFRDAWLLGPNDVSRRCSALASCEPSRR